MSRAAVPRASPADLGFRTGRFAAALMLGALVPGGVALWMCGSWSEAGVIAGTSLALAAVLLAMFVRGVQARVLRPLLQVATAMEQLQENGRAIAVEERGAPLLLPLLRQCNAATARIAERSQLDHETLAAVEIAFDRVHAVLHSLREGVVVVDDDGRIVLANRGARQALGETGRALQGQLLRDAAAGDLRAALLQSSARIEQEQAEEVRTAGIAYHGRVFDLTAAKVTSTRPDQDFGKVFVLVDVTREHEVSQLKDELLSTISHELRTPLTSMCSSSEILTQMDPRQDEDWREFACMLHQESLRLKTLVDDALEYSQIETGRMQWDRERIDVARQAHAALQLLLPRLAQGRLQPEFQATGAAPVLADGKRLTEVVARLLDNAVKFTPAGGRVRIGVHVDDGLVEVAVADSGPGIRIEDRQRVFERFSQIGDLLTAKPKGAGLGLAICQRIVDAMGGTIWCEDSPLGGAQFRFVLPLAESPAAATTAPA